MMPRLVLEKLASAIPGYTGYAALEDRRETDRALRRAIAQRLHDHRLAVQRHLADASRAMRLEALEPLEGLARRLDRLAELVRHAPAGYSGLFDGHEVGTLELDRLTEHDAELRDGIEELAPAIEALSLAGDQPHRRVEGLLTALEAAERRRDEILKGA